VQNHSQRKIENLLPPPNHLRQIINHGEAQVSREISHISTQIQAFPSLHILLNHSVYIIQSLARRDIQWWQAHQQQGNQLL